MDKERPSSRDTFRAALSFGNRIRYGYSLIAEIFNVEN